MQEVMKKKNKKCEWVKCENEFKFRSNKRFCSNGCRRNQHNKDEIKRVKDEGFFFLYYLPEEHYIGVTNDPKRRMPNHRSSGRITEGYEVFFKSKNPKLVAYYEALYHLIGYNGSNYENMITSRKNKLKKEGF